MATSARGGGEGGGVFTNIALAWLTVVAAKNAAINPLLLNRCPITPHLPIRKGHTRFAGPRIDPEEKGPDCSTAFLVCPHFVRCCVISETRSMGIKSTLDFPTGVTMELPGGDVVKRAPRAAPHWASTP